MKEIEINEKRNWKAMVLPYDEFIPDNSQECLYCLTEKQAEAIRGIVLPLAWGTRWYSDTREVDKDEIESFQSDIVRRLMMSCCGNESPIIYRYTVDGILQRSEDDGETWVDSPQNDPRNNSTTFPPVTGELTDDKKCIAATSAVTVIKEQIGDQLTDDMSRYTLGQLISDWVKTLIDSGGNIFQVLVTIATNQIFALIIAVLRPALTDEVYGKLLCIILENMSDDLSFTEGQWEQVRTDILAQITGVAGLFLEHLIYLIGKVGLTNLVRSQAATEGDCSDCNPCEGCDTSGWVIQEDVGSYVYGTLNPASDCNHLIIDQSTPGGDGNYYIKVFSPGPMDCCEVVSIVTSGSPAGILVAWDLVGETQGTFAHFGAITDPIGQCISSLLIRTSSPQTMTLTT